MTWTLRVPSRSRKTAGPPRRVAQGLAVTDSHLVWLTFRSGWETNRCQIDGLEGFGCAG